MPDRARRGVMFVGKFLFQLAPMHCSLSVILSLSKDLYLFCCADAVRER
jgi:hypothetical protein